MADNRDALLAEAAQLAKSSGQADVGVGDLLSYFRAYYRHVPEEDLAAAGAGPVAAVAVDQARLAADRPQGRTLIRVGQGGSVAAFDPASTVIDIITDDMPFLVDSVTMELARHGVSSYRVVHPQLLVRRDVAGALHQVNGALD